MQMREETKWFKEHGIMIIRWTDTYKREHHQRLRISYQIIQRTKEQKELIAEYMIAHGFHVTHGWEGSETKWSKSEPKKR